jgi:hypothetical protein
MFGAGSHFMAPTHNDVAPDKAASLSISCRSAPSSAAANDVLDKPNPFFWCRFFRRPPPFSSMNSIPAVVDCFASSAFSMQEWLRFAL